MTQPAPIAIRPARRDDLPTVVEMLADDPLGVTRERFEDPLPACYTEAFVAMENDPNNRLLVADINGQVVGCLQLTFIPGLARQGTERAQIDSVRVASSRRGKGLGRQLFVWAIEQARQRGCGLVQLTTDKSRGEAHRFYESLGFVASHEGMKLKL